MTHSNRQIAAGAAAASLSVARSAHAAGTEVIRMALVGCGNRGSGACLDALSTKAPVKLVAMGDLFANRLETSLKNLSRHDEVRERIDVPPERRFTGFDACEKVLAAGVDLVLFATPPHFRPMHFAAAVAAGKHVFLEKPCCVDAPGYRQFLAAADAAKEKRLSVGVGLQRRHQPLYLEKIKQIRDGAFGSVRLIRTYFNVDGGRAAVQRSAAMSEMEYQIRSWNLFCWLSGDHIVEQSCHSIDVANWIMDSHPVRANGMGMRQIRTGPGTGDIFDCHSVEFEYADGTRYYCQARQQPGTWGHVSENVTGTKGRMTLGVGPWGGRDSHAANAPRQANDGPESVSTRTRLLDGQHPRQRSLSLRGPIRRDQRHDGRDGPHGHLFGKNRHLGRGGRFDVAARTRPLRLRRTATDFARCRGELPLRDSRRDAGVVSVRRLIFLIQSATSISQGSSPHWKSRTSSRSDSENCFAKSS